MSYQEENKGLLDRFLNDSFFSTWTGDGVENFGTIELMYSPDCNLACDYCYLKDHGDELYPINIRNKEVELENTRMVLGWLSKNKYSPRIEIFSGEPMIQLKRLEAIYACIDHLAGNRSQLGTISVPTNYTFIADEGHTSKVEELLTYAKEKDVYIFLSASFDGKYMEQNRPALVPIIRDDNYYDRCFQFVKDHNFGFHPMLYADGMEYWIENFKWFMNNFKKYELPLNHLYLLEVRNQNWTKDNLKHYGEFINFLVHWLADLFKGNVEELASFLVKCGFNFLKGPLTTVGRGIGCSIQSTLFVRMGDLAIVPCHRTSYPPFITAQFVVEDGEIVDIEPRNITLMNAIYSFSASSQPYCSRCDIAELCSFGCLGSQYEVNKELFTPVPTVCQMYRVKMVEYTKALVEVGAFENVMVKINPQKRSVFSSIRRQLGI